MNQIERMASKAGTAAAPKFQVPLIKLHATKGKFLFKDFAKGTEEEIKSPFNIVILKQKKVLSMFSKKKSMWTSEYDGNNDVVSLFQKVDGTITHVESGKAPDLREKYPLLKSIEVAYALFDGDIVRVELKGTSLKGYYAILKEFRSEGKHTFAYDLALSLSDEVEGDMSSYYMVEYKIGSEVKDLDVVEEKMDYVVEQLKNVDTYYKTKSSDEVVADSVDEKANDEEDFGDFKGLIN